MESLKNQVNETVYLGIIDKVECERSIRMYSMIGSRAPVYCTGIEKAILAFESDKKMLQIVKGIEYTDFTVNTITDDASLIKELKTIRTQGFSLDKEEHESGVNCAAVPIFDHNGKVLGGVSVAGPSSRINKENLFDLAEEVKRHHS